MIFQSFLMHLQQHASRPDECQPKLSKNSSDTLYSGPHFPDSDICKPEQLVRGLVLARYFHAQNLRKDGNTYPKLQAPGEKPRVTYMFKQIWNIFNSDPLTVEYMVCRISHNLIFQWQLLDIHYNNQNYRSISTRFFLMVCFRFAINKCQNGLGL